MTQQPYSGGDLSYDEAHDAHVEQSPHPPRRDEGATASGAPADLSGDWSYDLAHDVPRG